MKTQLLDPANEIYYRAASLWEIAIKSSLRRKDFRIDLDALMKALHDSGFLDLPITALHAAGIVRLPTIHKDPFDRLLIAQSMAEPMVLLTNDAVLADYWDGVRLV
ncbi:MAG: type II toxin-antitoxin system VapC family toxin [Acidiferrobacterales bacterium]